MECTRQWLLIVLLASQCRSSKDFDKDIYDTENKSDWIDPTDMLNYDPITKTMKNRPTKEVVVDRGETAAADKKLEASLTEALKECKLNVSRLENEVTSFNQTNFQLQKRVEKCAQLTQEVFFQQYIRSILAQFKKLDKQNADSEGHYEVNVTMSSSQYHYLQDYSNNNRGSVQEVHSILSAMLKNSRWAVNEPYFEADGEMWLQFKEYLVVGVQVVTVLLGSLFFFIYVPRSPSYICMWLLLTIFVVSIPWNWWHLYKKEIAEQHAALFKEMPPHCRPDHHSAWSFLNSWMFGSDRQCTRYYESIEVDPFWEVPPTRALAVTFTKFFLEPAGHIGEAINKMTQSAFEGLPFYLGIPVYGLLVLLLVLLIMALFGYRLWTPFVRIEPHHRPVEQQNRQLEADNQVMANQITELQNRLATLEPQNRELEAERRTLAGRITELQNRTVEEPLPLRNTEDEDLAGQVAELQQRQAELEEARYRLDELQRFHNRLPGSHGEGDGPQPLRSIDLLAENIRAAQPSEQVVDESGDRHPVPVSDDVSVGSDPAAVGNATPFSAERVEYGFEVVSHPLHPTN